MDFETDTPKNSPNEPEMTGILIAFTSLAVAAAVLKSFSAPKGQNLCFAAITQLASTKKDGSKSLRNSSA